VALGFAVAVKLPGLLPAMVVAAFALPAPRRRLLPLAAGGVAGFGVPSLVFFAAAPGSFVRDVVTSQLGRLPSSGRATLLLRLEEITGIGAGTAAVAAAALVIAVTVVGLTVRGRRVTAVEWFALAAALLVGAAQLAPSQYYPQYAALLAPFVAMVLATGVDRLADRVRRPAAALAGAGAVLAVLCALAVAAVWGSSVADPGPAVDAVVPAGGCTLSDGPRLLVPSDRFVSDVPGCTLMIDSFGTMLSYSDDPAAGVAALRDALDHTDYLVLRGSAGSWLTGPYAALQGYIAGNFSLVRSGGTWIYVRHGQPVA